ncbi:MAG: glycoside hydrolase family 99-like domain-containing protein [Tannerella sp.]|jgi:hypothetical protein|nr:glycoside hydrolase family 99-like domain-containing protein [Tannerella sp.]
MKTIIGKTGSMVITAGIWMLLLQACRPETPRQAETAAPEYYVAAYVWPSCHDGELNRLIWPDGTGEWEVIRKGSKRFDGHAQPRQPLWGYEMDNDPRVAEKWIDAAADHGINVFIYDWYWYNEAPFLEDALNSGFLKAENRSRMQFCLMWANHDVYRSFFNVHRYGGESSMLWDAHVDWKSYKALVERVISRYFKQPNYFKIDGKPVFSIFDTDKLLESFGGSLEETCRALDYFREEVKKAGFPGLHIQWNQPWGAMMSNDRATQFSGRIDSMGFNSTTMYNMGGFNKDYLAYGANAFRILERMDSVLNVPVFPCVSIGWDDTPRFPDKDADKIVHYNNTPTSFAMLLLKAKAYADRHPEQPKLIVVNSWNEWVEGGYLLPDMLNGFGYLEAVKDVFVDGKYDAVPSSARREFPGH